MSPPLRPVSLQNVAAEKVEMYGHAFKKIQDATGIKEIDELVATFITAEVGAGSASF